MCHFVFVSVFWCHQDNRKLYLARLREQVVQMSNRLGVSMEGRVALINTAATYIAQACASTTISQGEEHQKLLKDREEEKVMECMSLDLEYELRQRGLLAEPQERASIAAAQTGTDNQAAKKQAARDRAMALANQSEKEMNAARRKQEEG